MTADKPCTYFSLHFSKCKSEAVTPRQPSINHSQHNAHSGNWLDQPTSCLSPGVQNTRQCKPPLLALVLFLKVHKFSSRCWLHIHTLQHIHSSENVAVLSPPEYNSCANSLLNSKHLLFPHLTRL